MRALLRALSQEVQHGAAHGRPKDRSEEPSDFRPEIAAQGSDLEDARSFLPAWLDSGKEDGLGGAEVVSSARPARHTYDQYPRSN